MTNFTTAIQEMRTRYVPRASVSGNYNVAKTARNATIITEEDREFIDFVGGVGVMNVGHNHPKVVAAIQAQLEKSIHPGFTVMQYSGYAKLAQALCELTAGDHEKQQYFLIQVLKRLRMPLKLHGAIQVKRAC